MPGGGVLNEIWIINFAAGGAWRLHEIPDDNTFGSLHPHVAPNGRALLWVEKYGDARLRRKGQEIGLWRLVLATLSLSGPAPTTTAITKVVPGAEGFYESHGFHPSSGAILFTAAFQPGVAAYDADIYSGTPPDGPWTQLTVEGFNEHAHFSPDATRIIWMNGRDIAADEHGFSGGTDYWLMDADGGNRQRLTYFNDPASSPQPGRVFVASDVDWAPNGHEVVAYLRVMDTFAFNFDVTRVEE